jgi:hypothetical protein
MASTLHHNIDAGFPFGGPLALDLLFSYRVFVLSHRPPRNSRLLTIAGAWLLAALTGAPGLPSRPIATLAAVPQPSRSASVPAFRLGTAAGPLGWSTAIGDFDTDGTPDVAVADRIVRPIPGGSYRLEFSVSGRGSNTVAFDSDETPLIVRASDVDHDNDLDVVITAALTRRVIAVWLNDGRGVFHASDARTFAAEVSATHSLGAADPGGTSGVVLSAGGDAGIPRAFDWAPAAPHPSQIHVTSVAFRSALLRSPASSRAPPQA